MWRLAIVVIAASGCDYFWRIDPVDVPAVPPTCTDRVIDDAFTTPDTWGGTYRNCAANTMEGSDQLVLALDGTSMCEVAGWATVNAYYDVALTAGGVIVEVPVVTSEAEAYTALQLNEADVSIAVVNGQLALTSYALVPTFASASYDATSMRWWRLRTDGTTVFADVSDGTTWQNLGSTMPQPVVTTTRLNLFLGYRSPPTAPATSTFTHLIVCR